VARRALVVDYFDYAARLGASARRVAHRSARHRLLRLCRASGCIGTSRGSYLARRRLLHLRRTSVCFGTSRGLSRDSSSTTSPRVGSSSTSSPTPRVRVPRHVAWLVAPLVVDYFDYAACLGASARHVLVAPLLVDYFAYDTRSGASARCAARHLARCRLLQLRCTSVCFGTSRGLSRDSSSTTSRRAGSSSTTSPTSCVRVPRLVAWLVAPLVVDYCDYVTRPGASARRAARRRLLRLCRASGCLGTLRGS
jgi:hypothetical protein